MYTTYIALYKHCLKFTGGEMWIFDTHFCYKKFKGEAGFDFFYTLDGFPIKIETEISLLISYNFSIFKV